MTSKLTRLVWLLSAASVSAVAQTDAWELGHPDAKMLIGVDLKGLRESALGQSVRGQMAAQPAQMGPAALAMGFLEKIDRVFISSPAIASPARSVAARRAGGAKENPPFLLVVEGTLPLQQLLAFLPGAPHRYRAVDVYRGTKPTDPSLAMLDARTIILGDEKSVWAAIDRYGHSAPAASAILSRAKELASAHDVWMIATEDLSKFQPANAGFTSPLAGKIRGLDMGFAVREGFKFEMSVATESDAVAAQLTQLLSAQIALAQAKSPETADAARKLQIGTEGNRLHVSLALTKEEFEQNLRRYQSARVATAISPPQPAAPQRPKTPGKIKIYGLDEGVREIQMTH